MVIAEIDRDVADNGCAELKKSGIDADNIDTPLVWTVEGVKEKMKNWLRDTPMGRLGRADEIACVVHFLASGATSLMIGSIVLADGGFTCW